MRLLAGLLDDAAVFPPGSLPPGEAVRRHQEPLRAPYAGGMRADQHGFFGSFGTCDVTGPAGVLGLLPAPAGARG